MKLLIAKKIIHVSIKGTLEEEGVENMNAYVRMERVEQFFIPITIHTVKVKINGASGGVL